MPTERAEFLDIEFDLVSVEQILGQLSARTDESPYGYLVTPNVDHIVRLEKSRRTVPSLHEIYRQADFCLCDSRVLSRLASWLGVKLTTVPGSDLTAMLFKRVIQPGDRIAIVGGDELLLTRLRDRFPDVAFVQHRPPMNLLGNSPARTAAAEFIAGQQPRFAFIAVGSPQQELIAAEVRQHSDARGLALCVGAALDFIAERQKRAPRAVRRLGLEWAHRLLSDPRRMWRRYLVEGPRIFFMAYRWRRNRVAL